MEFKLQALFLAVPVKLICKGEIERESERKEGKEAEARKKEREREIERKRECSERE